MNNHICQVCCHSYAEEEDMINCCLAGEDDSIFICPICRKMTTDLHEAIECQNKCKIQLNISNLEDAGQMRLIE